MEVLDSFRSGKQHLLIATDVAARGLDIKSIKTVINYDAARDIDTHIHRQGRSDRGSDRGSNSGNNRGSDWGSDRAATVPAWLSVVLGNRCIRVPSECTCSMQGHVGVAAAFALPITPQSKACMLNAPIRQRLFVPRIAQNPASCQSK
jgi:hypothetical protein